MDVKTLLFQAITCDEEGRILEAQKLYQDGIQILMEMVQKDTDAQRKKAYGTRIKDYITRAEMLKDRVQKRMTIGEKVANIPIDEDSTGNSYATLFANYLNEQVREVHLEEPYLVEKYQLQNFIMFLELLVKRCKHLRYVRVITKPAQVGAQAEVFDNLRADLQRRNITLHCKYDSSMHDRTLILSNGYIIKIGRGLHFFKPSTPLFSLGLCDFDFRKCLKTDVDIWRTKDFTT